MPIVTRKNQIAYLTAICEKLGAEVQTLRGEVTALRSQVSLLRSGDQDSLYCDEEEDDPPPPMGRQPLKDGHQMEYDRDRTLTFMELHRAIILPLFIESPSPSAFKAESMARFGLEWRSDHGFQMILERVEKCWNFIKASDRCHWLPIELASAFAGADRMEPRSSFDFFLKASNQERFPARHWAAMEERAARISESKRNRGKAALLRLEQQLSKPTEIVAPDRP